MPKVVPSRLKARARRAVEQRRQRGHGGGEGGRAARALDQPQHVHPEDRRRQRQQESGGAEQRQSQQPDAARADQVDQAAGHHDDAAIGQDVAVEHPVQLDGRAAQGLADGRQHHGRAGEAEWNEQGGQAGGKQLQPAPGSRGNGVRVSRHVAGSQEERRAWRHGPGKNRGWPLKKNRLVFRIFRTLKSVMRKSAAPSRQARSGSDGQPERHQRVRAGGGNAQFLRGGTGAGRVAVGGGQERGAHGGTAEGAAVPPQHAAYRPDAGRRSSWSAAAASCARSKRPSWSCQRRPTRRAASCG